VISILHFALPVLHFAFSSDQKMQNAKQATQNAKRRSAMRKRTSLISLFALPAVAAFGLAPATDAPGRDPNVQPAKVADGVRSVPPYPVLWPEMPAGPNKDVYLNACVTCHSQLYVLTQPRFSRKVWMAEIDKMKTSYGAQFDDKVMPQIADYLVAIRGTNGK
jgi:hypothetical protein